MVYGDVLSAAGGMDRIRANMGVCPQFDILWGELTGREHMLLYGSIKVCSPQKRRQASNFGSLETSHDIVAELQLPPGACRAFPGTW